MSLAGCSSIKHLLWTGGWDSTFRLIELARAGEEVQPHYLVDVWRKSVRHEFLAMDSIRRMIADRGWREPLSPRASLRSETFPASPLSVRRSPRFDVSTISADSTCTYRSTATPLEFASTSPSALWHMRGVQVHDPGGHGVAGADHRAAQATRGDSCQGGAKHETYDLT
jgi:hypothetical protein